MGWLRRAVQRMALVVLLLGGVGMLASMFLGTADVVGTQFLGHPLPGALELTESTMVLIVFGALAYAQIRRTHIRVEFVYEHVGPRVRAGMDVLADLAALAFFGLLLWQAFLEAKFSWEIGEATVGLVRFPLYPARTILAVGVALLLVQLVLDLVTDARRAAGLDPDLPGPSLPDLPPVADIGGLPGVEGERRRDG